MISGFGADLKGLAGGVTSGLKRQPYFEIKRGILYQYEKKKAKKCEDKFLLQNVSAVRRDVDKDGNEAKSFSLMYKQKKAKVSYNPM